MQCLKLWSGTFTFTPYPKCSGVESKSIKLKFYLSEKEPFFQSTLRVKSKCITHRFIYFFISKTGLNLLEARTRPTLNQD